MRQQFRLKLFQNADFNRASQPVLTHVLYSCGLELRTGNTRAHLSRHASTASRHLVPSDLSCAAREASRACAGFCDRASGGRAGGAPLSDASAGLWKVWRSWGGECRVVRIGRPFLSNTSTLMPVHPCLATRQVNETDFFREIVRASVFEPPVIRTLISEEQVLWIV